MAVRPILDYTQPILRRKTQAVGQITSDVRRLIRDMRDTMKDAPGVGLAAPQVGVDLQIVVYDTGEERGCLINPSILESHGEQTEVEGCLSIPGLQGDVTRAMRVVVSGLDDRKRPVRLEAGGYLSRVLQHEIDHLNGILFIDRAIPETLHRVENRKPAPGIRPPVANAR
jgi:peptide deformylase